MLNSQQVMKKREEILNEIQAKRGSSQIELSDQEKKVDAKLHELKNQILQNEQINLYEDFYQNQKKFQNSQLFKELRAMPKANIAHLHYPASITQDFYFSTIKNDRRIFIDKNFNVKIILSDQDEVDGFVRVEKYLKTHPFDELQKNLLDSGFFVKKRFCCRNTQ